MQGRVWVDVPVTTTRTTTHVVVLPALTVGRDGTATAAVVLPPVAGLHRLVLTATDLGGASRSTVATVSAVAG
jgi:hypothetical protein